MNSRSLELNISETQMCHCYSCLSHMFMSNDSLMYSVLNSSNVQWCGFVVSGSESSWFILETRVYVYHVYLVCTFGFIRETGCPTAAQCFHCSSVV